MKNNPMTTCVVIATYNGCEYIVEQLDSIKNQTYPVDKVIIRDDGSTDNTVDVIHKYIIDNKLNWEIRENEKNLGWRRNFFELIKEADTDLVFLCDQDDIWEPDKVEIYIDIFRKKKRINVLASNYKVLSDDDQFNSLWDSQQDDKKLKKFRFDSRFYYIRRPGCTFCFRNEYVRRILKYWDEDWAHDMLIWLCAVVSDNIYLYNGVTMQYRRYGNNATGNSDKRDLLKGSEFIIQYADKALMYLREIKNYAQEDKLDNLDYKKKIINQAIDFFEIRKKWAETKKFSYGIRLLKYIRFYMSPKQYLGDWVRIYR